jgi:hypothetical protein
MIQTEMMVTMVTMTMEVIVKAALGKSAETILQQRLLPQKVI